MNRRNIVVFCSVFCFATTGAMAGAANQQKSKGTAVSAPDPDAREKAELRAVEQKFVTEQNKLIQEYKARFGGGKYYLIQLKDPQKDLPAAGVEPTPEMTACGKLFVVDMSAKKGQEPRKFFYCKSAASIKKVGSYTKQKSSWVRSK